MERRPGADATPVSLNLGAIRNKGGQMRFILYSALMAISLIGPCISEAAEEDSRKVVIVCSYKGYIDNEKGRTKYSGTRTILIDIKNKFVEIQGPSGDVTLFITKITDSLIVFEDPHFTLSRTVVDRYSGISRTRFYDKATGDELKTRGQVGKCEKPGPLF